MVGRPFQFFFARLVSGNSVYSPKKTCVDNSIVKYLILQSAVWQMVDLPDIPPLLLSAVRMHTITSDGPLNT